MMAMVWFAFQAICHGRLWRFILPPV